ncbi:acidic fibroblast growth factor intracellular-binding protein [Plasmopara halstedii]|uniref:Acidic fibroblast growth factor intracellular-binding protein n=1 Tax=Plasmopara halstedii TaxID=4781 RepID=A0A0P1ANV8_PLAHL|nr:acidic fibroblast growth factor intracellular-binding protein [Plasmopara halstedii]CEG42958.1 acidic fibroblast growth factor intracellular-binding protein [Plasmopara halstedii]|eukprot:XP_024579327.1 acidic fibroblast growth factor intracellular-binding protein [Plasmopara halstedii]
MIMTHWIPQQKLLTTLQSSQSRKETVKDSVVSNGAQIVLRSPSTKEWPRIDFLQERLQPTSVRETIGLELSHPLTNCLRDLKAYLINDNDVLRMYQENVISRLRCSATANGTLSRYSRSLNKLESNLHLVVHGFLTIGAGLSQPKELQHFLEYLFTRVVRVLHNCVMTKSLLDKIFTALIDALIELDVWYLNGQESLGLMLSSWDRFLSVCRAIVLQVYDRCQFSTTSQVLSDEDVEEMRNDAIANAFESQGN